MSNAIRLLSDHASPDVRNSIKESISAVESIVGAIVGKNDTLGAALKKLENAGMKIHPALRDGWSKMYGYTSGADGIRHALHGEPNLTVDDAIYFAVSCSAFISLLTAKAGEYGIELQALES